jgi:integrase-like protein/Arm domain-containing DNA-binding protein
MGLGKLADFKLDEARERARKARQLLRDGVDPIAQKQVDKAQRALEEAKLITFETATRQYLEQHEGAWKNPKSAKNFQAAMEKYVFPTIGRLSVAAIDVGLVLKCIEPIWREIPVSADRIRNRIEAVLDWCTVRGYRKGDNPAFNASKSSWLHRPREARTLPRMGLFRAS